MTDRNETIRDPHRVKSEALEAIMRIWGRCAAGTDAPDMARDLHKLISEWKA